MAELVDARVLGTRILAMWRFKSSLVHWEIGAAVAQLLYTETVTGSNPVFPMSQYHNIVTQV